MNTSSKKNLLGVIGVFLAIVMLLSALGVVTKGFRDWDYKHWFNRNDTVLDPSGGVVDGDGNELDSNKVYPMSNMVFKSPSANSAAATTGVNVKATILPVDATNQKVDWLVAFVNPASTWATGKTIASFVTATPSADGSLTATIECLAAFGEQIKIVVTSRENSSAKAECVIDYAKRLERTKAMFGSGPSGINCDRPVGINSVTWKLHGNIANAYGGVPSFTYLTSLGTIEDVFSTVFYVNIKNLNSSTSPKSIEFIDGNDFFLDELIFKKFFSSSCYNTPVVYNDIVDSFGISPNACLEFILSTSGKYSTFTNSCTVPIDVGTSFKYRVTDVTINNPTLVF